MIQSELYSDVERHAETMCLTVDLTVDNSLQFCDVGDAASKNKGETWTWDVVANVATQGGTLVETNTMPETQFTITQGTLTITEYGNSVPYSGKLEALSKFSVRKPVMQALRNDANKVLDKAAYAQFYLAPIRITPRGLRAPPRTPSPSRRAPPRSRTKWRSPSATSRRSWTR